MSAAAARLDPRAMAVCVRYLEVSAMDVLTALRAADDDAAVHAVFPRWNKLPTVLLKSSGVALELGLAPLIAIAVDRPVDQVHRRLRAVPTDTPLSAVFQPELARRLLGSADPR